jgi:hypothetical protein
MFSNLVADIGRVLKKGSKIRIPNLGILQVHSHRDQGNLDRLRANADEFQAQCVTRLFF